MVTSEVYVQNSRRKRVKNEETPSYEALVISPHPEASTAASFLHTLPEILHTYRNTCGLTSAPPLAGTELPFFCVLVCEDQKAVAKVLSDGVISKNITLDGLIVVLSHAPASL